MKTESSLEIIEIIDDDADAFGARASTPSHDSGRRWVTPVVAATLVAVIGYAVVASAISSDAKTRPTPTSVPGTTATPAIQKSTVQTAPATTVSADYYLAEPVPSGFTMLFADSVETGGSFGDGGTAELWATVGATSTTGSWFEVSSGTHHSTGRSAYRTVVDQTEVVVEHDPLSGQSRLSFTKDGNEMEVTAFGWADRQLLRLASSASVVDSTIRYRDTFFTSDHTRLLASDPTTALYGQPVAVVGYTAGAPADLTEGFTITVAGHSAVDSDLAARFALRDETTFTIGGLPAFVGHSAAEPRVSIVQLRDGDHLITLRGNIDADRLAAIAATVHRRPNADVTSMIDANSVPSSFDGAGVPHTIVSGMLADGRPWTIQVSSRNRADSLGKYLWWIAQPGDSTVPSEVLPSQADASPSIETLVEHGRTYVLARTPRTMTGAQLHVNPNGQPSEVAPLLDIAPSLADLFTAYVFLEPVPFTAQIVDGSGTTVASWPVTG